MEQYKQLFSNSVIFAIGNLGSKVITFLMLPLYTYTLSTVEYGTVDLIVTTTSLLLPIVSLNIFDAVLRYAMDKRYDSKIVFTNGFFISIISATVLGILVPIAWTWKQEYSFLLMLLIIQLFQNLFAQYAKAINEVKLFALNGIILSFSTAILNIVFLLVFDMKIIGYLVSLVIANFLATLYLYLKLNVFRLLNFKLISRKSTLKLMKFSIPLIPNSIAWWATTAVGRYFVILFLGTAFNGIFAVANKIPTLLTVFTTIFAQSWQISAIEEYENKKDGNFVSSVYNFYFFLLYVGSSGLLLFLKPLITLLVSDDFFISWVYIPFLLYSVIFSSAASFLGAQYIAMENTTEVFKTTILGAVLNIILSLILIQLLGLNGVGVSSFISFFIVWYVRHKKLEKSSVLYLNYKIFIINFFVVLLQCVCYMFNLGFILEVIQIGSFVTILLVNRLQLKKLSVLILNKLKANNKLL
ncbi:TPA: oligosaccharide flippase family protein [Enterococcus faecium]|nr:oligosaccharide flippase family protein [Enterococcus faecium]